MIDKLSEFSFTLSGHFKFDTIITCLISLVTLTNFLSKPLKLLLE